LPTPVKGLGEWVWERGQGLTTPAPSPNSRFFLIPIHLFYDLSINGKLTGAYSAGYKINLTIFFI
ncbi:MAG: hypothetical protein ACLFUU_13445, partial [Desulfobacteraceae bacterium]